MTVCLSVNAELEEVILEVIDDGPGLTPESLKRYGQRAHARTLEKNSKGNVSTGLGSVIATSIANLHGGVLGIENRLSATGAVMGAKVTVRLPLLDLKKQAA